jgi:hypothetical protein
MRGGQGRELRNDGPHFLYSISGYPRQFVRPGTSREPQHTFHQVLEPECFAIGHLER